MRNRRNYYRILHVQQDAPAELIKSCYRALMRALAIHPDRGGDHWNAAVLNEAYGVLSDPLRRAEYDRELGILHRRGPVGLSPLHPPIHAERSAQTDAGAFCVFCGLPHGPLEASCARCASPLVIDGVWRAHRSGRRAVARQALDRPITLHDRWPPTATHRGRIRDLSPGGLRLDLDRPLDDDAIVRLEGAVLTATARVVHCRPRDPSSAAGYDVGVEFFTLLLKSTTGVFVSVSG